MPFPTARDFTDDFNRANETPMSFSGMWEADGGNSPKLENNTLMSNTIGARNSFRTDTTYGQDQEGWIEWIAGTDTFRGMGVSCRDGKWFAYFGANSSKITLTLEVDPWPSWDMKTSYTASAGDKLGLQCIGDTAYVWLDEGSGWVLEGSQTDSDGTSTGKIGFSLDDDGSGVRTKVDNVGGGNYVAPVLIHPPFNRQSNIIKQSYNW